MSILKERNMRIYSWMEAVLGFILGLVALVAACGSFVVAVTAKEMVLGMVAGLISVAGWVLGTYLVVVCGSEDSILAMLRKQWWQRWGTSPIRRHLIHLREKVGQRMAKMTMAHKSQVIDRLSGAVFDLLAQVGDLNRMVAAMNRDNYKLWMQIRSLKRAKEACIRQARWWKQEADFFRLACIRQEEELRRLRPRRKVMRAFYARGEKPEGMSLRLWADLNRLVKDLPSDQFMAVAKAIAEIEERNRQCWRWSVLLKHAGCAHVVVGEEAPGMIDGYSIDRVLKPTGIDGSFMISCLLAQAMNESGLKAALDATKESRVHQHAYFVGFGHEWTAKWNELSRLVSPRD